MKEALTISNLFCGYGREVLIHDFSARVDLSEMIAVVGTNGSGKSTLLKTISGQLKSIQGEITVSGINIQELDHRKRARYISSVQSKVENVPNLDVLSVVTLGRYATTDSVYFFKSEDEEVAKNCLHQMQISHLMHKSVDKISDGEFQKVMIARALAQSAKWMILDEPTAYLDYKAKNSVMKILSEQMQSQGLSVIFSSHDLDMVSKYASRIWFVDNQKIVERSASFIDELRR